MSNCYFRWSSVPSFEFEFNTIAINVSEHVNYSLPLHRFLLAYVKYQAQFIYFFFIFLAAKTVNDDDETVGWSGGIGNDIHRTDADSIINSLHVHAKTFTIIILRFRLR